MAKAQAFKTVGEVISLDISPNRQLIFAGSKQHMKIVSIKTQNNYWFEVKKGLNRLKSKNGEFTPLCLTSLSCNKNNKLAIATSDAQNSIYIYDVGDFNSFMYQNSISGIFDRSSCKRIQWGPQQHVFTGISDNQLIKYDVRSKQIVSTIQIEGQKLSEFKYNHLNSNLIAFTTRTQKINIYDFRNTSQPVMYQQVINFYEDRKIPIDWSPDSTMIANGFRSKIKLWNINGGKFKLFDEINCAQQIKKMKWLKKKKNQHYLFLANQKKPSKLCQYDLLDPNKYVGQYFTTTDYNYQLNDWVMDNEEQLVILTYAQVNTPRESIVSAQFEDNIVDNWSGKYNYPIQFDNDNNLLFPTKKWGRKKIEQSSPVILTQRIESVISIADYNYFDEFNRQVLLSQDKLEKKKKKKQIKKVDRRQHSQNTVKSLQKYGQKSKSEQPTQAKKRRESFIKIEKNKSSQSHKSLLKRSMISIGSQYSSQSSQEQIDVHPQRYLLSKKEEYEYLIKNYRMCNKKETLQEVIEHNSYISGKLGKIICMQFWILLFSIAFPEQQNDVYLEDIYEEGKKRQISINNNKITVIMDEDEKQQKTEDIKSHCRRLVQQLVDENQLQTAVIGATILRAINPELLEELYFHQLLNEYETILRTMELHVESIEIRNKVGMNNLDNDYERKSKIKIKCFFCRNAVKECICGLFCIFCNKKLSQGFITVCKVCGHAGHTKQYEQWFIKNNNKMCPYQCGHQCFNEKSFEMKLKKIEKN